MTSNEPVLTYEFRAEPERRPAHAHPDAPPKEKPEPYVAAPELIQAVNLAIFLKRPLLLEGEAGCGKTRLARAVAYELGLPFYPWYVRSTSKAREGLYEYDAILRLHDVQTRQLGSAAGPPIDVGERTSELPRNPGRPTDYRRFGALGKAFRVEDRPAVVLIDEIDKADVDFPNDLLSVLDDPREFEIPETGEVIQAHKPPIVIITSNKEKGNLPAPFLRRCIYYFVNFPDLDQLRRIVAEHHRVCQTTAPPQDLTDTAANRFLDLRQNTSLYKKPGTSEFLDWLQALHAFALPDRPLAKLGKEGVLPYPELLFKLRSDWLQHTAAR